MRCKDLGAAVLDLLGQAGCAAAAGVGGGPGARAGPRRFLGRQRHTAPARVAAAQTLAWGMGGWGGGRDEGSAPRLAGGVMMAQVLGALNAGEDWTWCERRQWRAAAGAANEWGERVSLIWGRKSLARTFP